MIESLNEIKAKLERIRKLQNRSCTTCINGCCTIPTHEKQGMEDGKPAGSECIGWQNDLIVQESLETGILDVDKILQRRKQK